METRDKKKTYKSLYLSPVIAGGTAGIVLATAIYPLDTLKTRLQAAQGFKQAGGFRGVYKGLLTAAIGSTTWNGLFFLTYETIKRVCVPLVPQHYVPVVYMFAGSFCEVVASLVRVPTEIVKQRKQTGGSKNSKSAVNILVHAYRTEGFRRGIYRGYMSTVLRDIPFSFIELPIWELLKSIVRGYNNGQITSIQSGGCGAIAGGIAAMITTPIDVAKTRIMLAGTGSFKDGKNGSVDRNVARMLNRIYVRSGVRGLFAGASARVAMFMVGEFAFYTTYESVKRNFEEFIGES